MLELTEESWGPIVVQGDRPAFVQFGATWSAPCRIMRQRLDPIATHFAHRLTVAYLNVDDQPQIAVELRIVTIPLFILFRGGEPRTRLVGMQTEEALVRLLYSVVE